MYETSLKMENRKIKIPVNRNPNPRAHRVLFDEDSPFRPKKVKSQLQYQRKPKHRNQGENDV